MDDKEISSTEAMSLDKDEDNAKSLIHGDAKTFKSSETQYKDYTSSAFILLIFGILGTVFIILNIVHVLNIFNSTFQYVVGLTMFICFLLGSIYCFLYAKRFKKMISAENKQQDDIISFLNDTVSNELLESFDNDGESDEANYLSRVSCLKELVLKEYPNTNEDFVESLIEDFYNEHY